MKKNIFKRPMSRREFNKVCFGCAMGLTISPALLDFLKLPAQAAIHAPEKGFIAPKEALYYVKRDEKTIQCQLCPRACVLSDGMRGFCRAREARQGKLYSLVYANPCAVNPRDPIEKKPLFHFLPATMTFSVAMAGCNYRCKCCQNWQISQISPEEAFNYNLSPEDAVRQAKELGVPTIAYTYTEPSIFYEYMFDTAKIAKARGVRNVYHSNGSLNAQAVIALAKYLDAANIDLKGFNQAFYSKIPEGYLSTVLETLQLLKQHGVWVEITTLIIPTLNDNAQDIRAMAAWIKEHLGAQTPLHFSRFQPLYQLKNMYSTPISTLEQAREIAMEEGLLYVYIGNVPGNQAESTYCPQCKKPVIIRRGYTILEKNIDAEGRSKCCAYPIAGVWS